MENGMKEMAVASLGLDKSSSTPVVILKEKEGERLLPIWIGPGEASAIAMELAGVEFSRPLTHDLLNDVVKGLGSALLRVLITKVVDNTFYASLVFRKNGQLISVDSRPSDSIALALRARAPIFADETLLELSALEVDLSGAPEEPATAGAGGEAADEPAEPLEDYLKRLNPEDFGRFKP